MTRAEIKRRYRERHPERVKQQNRSQYQRQRENLESFHARRRAYYSKNKEKILEYNRRWRSANKLRLKGYSLASAYKITVADFERLRVEQKCRCAICATRDPRLYVDHNHASGMVRGLLCRKCNLLLGYFEKHIVKIGLDNFIRYLKEKDDAPRSD